MKRLIASDLHGSLPYCRQLLDLYRQEGAEQLVLLGDLAYSGSYDPRSAMTPRGSSSSSTPWPRRSFGWRATVTTASKPWGLPFP